ncbi:hypothetical protein RUMGNA_00346 [Mediterraneibacter gnavus ATCC 29149]|jgi:hypothetical protein|uniref:Uncharacterized protein n=1 Tax=Mediterraneibacter gnavus (strain ATCC 29149 / DSM 114966 / JCM 6515 / VPI C7-9) TaxID=411470 RepID=A7AYI1_MEDG7|nr:hypothetical protein RUMGNA_00346 [Mediterraneibacter gnavus ATCC 29149]
MKEKDWKMKVFRSFFVVRKRNKNSIPCAESVLVI